MTTYANSAEDEALELLESGEYGYVTIEDARQAVEAARDGGRRSAAEYLNGYEQDYRSEAVCDSRESAYYEDAMYGRRDDR